MQSTDNVLIKKRRLAMAIAVFLLISCNDHPTQFHKSAFDSADIVFRAKPDEKDMNEAIVEAKRTLSKFYANLKLYDTIKRDAFVKVAFDVIDDANNVTNTEHIWLTDLEIRNDSLFGIVNNVPEATKQVKLGERIYIDTLKISDWCYIENGRMYGGYTMKVEYRHASEQLKRQMELSLGCKIE